MTPVEAQLHIRYSIWASRRLLAVVEGLPAEDRERPTGISHGSLLGTLAHVMHADWYWYTQTVGPRERPAVTLEALQGEWAEIQRGWEAWSDAVTDAGLAGNVTFRRLNGFEAQIPVWQVILHMVNHGTLHRGQVAGMLRQMGVAPPNTDLIGYYLSLAATAASA